MKKMYRMAVFCLLLAGCGDSSDNIPGLDPGPPEPEPVTARAAEVADAAELISGPLARGVVGDFLLENSLLKVIIQQPGRQWFGVGTYGGNIIDVSRKDAQGGLLPDHLEEFVTGVNIENTPNYTEVRVVNAGDNGEPAQICARGPDDLLDFLNASSKIQDLGGGLASLPASADDRDLPLEIETCYSLAADEPWVTVDTRLINTSSDDLDIWMVEYLNGSGEVEAFQPQLGFGEPLFTPGCPAETAVACDSGECDQCNYLAYSGHDGATGVSYGLIHEETGTTTLSTDGVNVMVLGQAVLNVMLGISPPNFHIPADGELSLRRYFAVGDGNASSIADIRNRISGIHTGELSGTVTSAGEPVPGASVSVFQTVNGAVALFVAGSARTDSEGNYRMSLPPGDYEVQANAEGYLFADDVPAQLSIARDETSVQDFTLPEPGYLQVGVTAQPLVGSEAAVPAKLQVVGFDPSPALRNSITTALGILSSGVFGDDADSLPYGVTLVEFIDRSGMTERLALEPGDYQVVVSLGPRHSVYKQDITVVSGQTVQVQAELAQVLATDGYVYGDFHVHAIDSPDSEVNQGERVATYLAEGMDFFTPSEHGMRVDFSPVLVEMDVVDLIGTAPSGEITPFDYGHFNSWPVTVDESQISGGSVDWGREAQPGMDFPEYASYVLTPAEIFSESLADPKANIVQINHIGSHFGGGGLGIDTAMTPPQSTVDPALRRLDPGLANAFDDGFQALEVWIGTNGRSGIINEFLGQNLGDWFNLINQGIVRTGVADSDTHSRRNTHLSVRSQVASSVSDPGQLSGLAETLAATVAAGKVVGTNAPFVEIGASGSFLGNPQAAGLGVGDAVTLAIDSGSDVEISLDIATAAWAGIDSVDFYINNQPELSSVPPAAVRYGVCADMTISRGDPGWSETQVIVDAGIPGASRNEISVSLTLPALTEDIWLVAIAHGSDGVSAPLFPVVPEDIDPSTNTTLAELTDDNIGEEGVLAYAFTNPLFVDVGGDGWSSPGVAVGPCTL
jgi:hypothetical protein